MRVKEIIAVTNDKGGVAKTTTAQNLATGLLLRGYRTLIIDADSQRCASHSNGWDMEREEQGERTLFDAMSTSSPLPIYRSKRGLFYVPSSKRMVGIEPFLKQELTPGTVLRKLLHLPCDDHTGCGVGEPMESFDYIVIDCPPSLGIITINMMAAATGLIIPVQPEGYSVLGLGEVTHQFKLVKDSLNPALQIRGLLLVMVDMRLKKDQVYHADIGDTFTDLVFRTYIRRNTRIPESQEGTSDIFLYAPKSSGAKDYNAFVDEFLSKSADAQISK